MVESEYILKHPFEISSAEADMYGRLRPGALLNFLIQMAGKSADQLKFGYNDLSEKQLFWVLSRMSIQIERPLKWQESITVYTWPKTVAGLLYLRDFLVKDADGKDVVKASSAWLAIDANSRRPKLIQGLEEPFKALKDMHALEAIPEKLGAVDGKTVSERLVTFTDVDLNKHLTSVRYIDWLMDCLPIGFHEKNYPKYLIINYIKENSLGESIRIDLQESNDELLIEGVNLKTGQPSYRAKVNIEPFDN